MRLICTKAMTYNTRRLLPGDEFEAATPRDARVLIAIRKAEQRAEAKAKPVEKPDEKPDDEEKAETPRRKSAPKRRK